MSRSLGILSSEVDFKFVLMAVGLYGLVIPKAIFNVFGVELGSPSYAIQWVITILGFLMYVSDRWKPALGFRMDINDYMLAFLYCSTFLFGFVHGTPEYYFWSKMIGWFVLGVTQYLIARTMTSAPESFEKLFFGVLVVGVLLLILSVFIPRSSEFQRFTVTGSVPIAYARMLAITIILCIWCVERAPNIATIISCILISSFSFVFLLKTGTRWMLIAMVLAFAVYFPLSRMSKSLKIGICVVIFALFALLFEKYGTLLIYRFKNAEFFIRAGMALPTVEASASWRVYYWKTAIRKIIENPLVGIGTDRFDYVLPQFFRPLSNVEPHNIFLEFGCEVGIWAMAVFLLMLGITLWRGWMLIRKVYLRKVRTPYNTSVLLVIVSIFVFAVSECFVTAGVHAIWWVWFSMGAITSLYQDAKQRGYL